MDGLNCFDGKNIRVYRAGDNAGYALIDNNIQSPFFEDEDGNIWFSTVKAVYFFNRKSGKIKPYNHPDIRKYRIAGIYKQETWVFSSESGELYRLSKKGQFSAKQRLFEDVHWGYLDFDSKGELLYLFAYSYNALGLQINSYKKDSLIQQKILYSLNGEGPALRIRHLLKEGNQTYWLSTDKGLYLFDAKNYILKQIFTKITESSDWLNASAHINGEYLLCAFAKSGLAIIHKSSGALVRRIAHDYRNPHSLAGNNLTNVVIDAQGNLFVSVDGIGVDFSNIWQRRPFGRLLTNDSDSSLNFQVQAAAMVEDAFGNILCSAWKNGILLLDKNKSIKTHFYRGAPRDTILSNYVSHLFKDDIGRIWISTFRGVGLWNPASKKIKPIEGFERGVLFGYQLKSREILFCDQKKGIYRLTEKSDGKFNMSRCIEFDTSHQYTTIMESSSGELLAAKDNGVLEVYTFKDGYKLKKSLHLDASVNCIWENRQTNTYWHATNNGLIIVRLDNMTYKTLTEKQGLPDRTIHSILSTRDHQIWVSTNRGLSKTDPQANKFECFTYSDGLSANEFRRYAAMIRANGEFWFGSNNGITFFDPSEIANIPVFALPQITEILVNDKERFDSLCVSADAQNATEVKNLVFDHNNSTLTFSIAALEYCDPENVKLRYYMQGVDHDTMEFEGHGLVRYPNLTHGQYTFSVWAANSDGFWNPEPRVLAIEILPPFWKTWWFISLCILAIVLLAWYAYVLDVRRRMKLMQLKLERQIAVEQERKRIARDMHDDIGSGLSELGLIAELAKQKSSGVGAKKDLDKLIHSSREISGKLRELIWTVYSQNDTLEKLISFLHTHALDFFENSAIDCYSVLPEHVPNFVMTGQKRHMILMAFKEALNNVQKHSKARSVKVSFEQRIPLYLIIVQDDGRGFDTSIVESPVGYGLSNMHARMADIGGECTILSKAGGTTVTLSFEV